MEPLQKLRKARTNLVFDRPFFGAICLRLKMQENKKMEEPRFITDGYTIEYHPELIETLEVSQIETLLAAQVMKIVLFHTTRCMGREQQKFDTASELVINTLLDDQGFNLPPDAILDKQFKDSTVEKVYAQLKNEQPPQGKQYTSTKPPPADKKATAKADAKALTTTGEIAAKQAGKLPGSILDKIRNDQVQKVRWQDSITELLKRSKPGNMVWHKPNKRLLDTVYLPHYEPKPTGELVIAVDTSCSVSDRMLRKAAPEIEHIIKELGIEKTTVLYIDTNLQSKQDYTEHDTLNLVAHGRGGTDFKPAFDYIKNVIENGEDPCALLYFTDMEAHFPKTPPQCPIIWANLHKKVRIPYGTQVMIE